ncbi:hypothetical protein ACLIYM_22240 [Streptomyces fenghuangensis]|uniref:hypothetical protein n=1 Tax=Streptomyces sp. ICN903 TaxID=2964654 RepID=UPI001EDBDD2F|nr:hypothetical protein [Streptomyces sp. ICN903]MCG3039460.1 hypothetical protein [Streptomyces sp. ICN903]
MASAAVFALSPGAWANWSSSISGWTDGGGSNGQSRYWADQSYTEIIFKGCSVQGGSKTTGVELWDYDALSSNDFYGEKTFTNCFKGASYASRGAYNGLPQESDYFFQLDNVGGGSYACCLLWASYAGVDTTLADS